MDVNDTPQPHLPQHIARAFNDARTLRELREALVGVTYLMVTTQHARWHHRLSRMRLAASARPLYEQVQP